MCTRYPILNRVSELKVHIELTRFVQPEKIEIDANERAVNEKMCIRDRSTHHVDNFKEVL